MGHARALINIDTIDNQLFIFNEVKNKQLSVRQTEELYPPEYDPATGRFIDARVLGKDHRIWLGYVDGGPVATAAAFHHDQVNLIKNVSTAAAYLGRGIAQAMSDHAVR